MSDTALPTNGALRNGALPNSTTKNTLPETMTPETAQTTANDNTDAAREELWKHLRLPHFEHDHPPVANANTVYEQGLTPLDKLAVAITDKVGSMGFFLAILAWTILWTGYNILASEVHSLHWKAFDPFPAFVAYLLISNVIQILLMPLIMVGQNVQGRHSEIRAQLDFEVNEKAEKEIMVVLRHLEHSTELVIKLMQHLEYRVSDEELRAIAADHEQALKQEAADPQGDGAEP